VNGREVNVFVSNCEPFTFKVDGHSEAGGRHQGHVKKGFCSITSNVAATSFGWKPLRPSTDVAVQHEVMTPPQEEISNDLADAEDIP